MNENARGFRSTGRVLQREWGFVTGLLTDLDPGAWASPTRCAGWSIGDLTRHVVWGVSMEADALRRARTGVPGTAEGHTLAVDATPATILGELNRAVDDLVSEVSGLEVEPVDRLCPLPYGEAPVAVALDIFVFEAGLHASDFAHATGEDRPLADDVVPHAEAVLTLFLPAFASAGTSPPEATSFCLGGANVLLAGRWTASGLVMGDADEVPTFAVLGDDSSVLLFANGRLGLDDPRLRVEGSTDLAQRFKSFVPGP